MPLRKLFPSTLTSPTQGPHALIKFYSAIYCSSLAEPEVKRCRTNARNVLWAGCDRRGQQLFKGRRSTGLARHVEHLRWKHWPISSCDSLVTFEKLDLPSMLETEFEFEIYRTALSPLATRERSSTFAFTAATAPKMHAALGASVCT